MIFLFLSLQFSSKSSGASKGDEWTNTLYFTSEPENPGSSPTEIKDHNLESYFDKVEGTGENIEKVEIFKIKLSLLSSRIPVIAGAWHEFTVVKSENWYWSFEKNSKGIYVQQGKTAESVKDYCFGEKRTKVNPEGRHSEEEHEGDTIQDIFIWIYSNDHLNQGYHATKSNCHHFASLVFEAIARQNGRQL